MITRAEIDPAELTAAVRAAEGDPSFAVLDWEVQILSTGGGVNDGLLRVNGLSAGTIYTGGSRPV